MHRKIEGNEVLESYTKKERTQTSCKVAKKLQPPCISIYVTKKKLRGRIKEIYWI